MTRLLLAIVMLVTVAACEKPSGNTLVQKFDNKAMDKAIATARANVDSFIEVLEQNAADSYSVKVPITDNDYTEHFWMNQVRYANGHFSGKIANEPGVVKNVRFGQSWMVKKENISDWMYKKGNKIYGAYTLDPLLPSINRAEADALRAQLVR